MKKIGKKWGSLLLAGLLLAASLPIGALAQEPAGEEPASQEGFVYQWGDGDESYALRETQDTLGGGEAGRTAARPFAAPLGSYDDGSFYGQLTARQKACYDALAAIPLSQILTASENQGYKQVRVGVDEFYGLGMTGYILNQVFTPSASSEPLYRQLYTDICAAITALRYDKADACGFRHALRHLCGEHQRRLCGNPGNPLWLPPELRRPGAGDVRPADGQRPGHRR